MRQMKPLLISSCLAFVFTSSVAVAGAKENKAYGMMLVLLNQKCNNAMDKAKATSVLSAMMPTNHEEALLSAKVWSDVETLLINSTETARGETCFGAKLKLDEIYSKINW
jgi:hypothetical protein